MDGRGGRNKAQILTSPEAGFYVARLKVDYAFQARNQPGICVRTPYPYPYPYLRWYAEWRVFNRQLCDSTSALGHPHPHHWLANGNQAVQSRPGIASCHRPWLALTLI